MSGGSTNEPTARDIALALNERAETLARQLFPAGVTMGGYFCIGSIHGEAGKTLKIRLSGDKRGSWADYACDRGDREGTGDMLRLVQLTIGQGELGKAVKWAKGWLGWDHMDGAALRQQRDRAERAQAKAEREAAGKREKSRLNAIGLWQHARPMQASPAQAYLEGRGIDFAALGGFPGAIRFRHDVGYNDGSGKKWHERPQLPAMVSLFVCGLTARPMGVHVTYLERGPKGWVKAPFADAKKIWGPTYWGAHIPLWKGTQDCTLRDVAEGTVPRIAEGIENGLSVAMADPSRRYLAAGTGGNIGAMNLPPQVRAIELLCDNDPPGSQSDNRLEASIARHQGEGREVWCLWPDRVFKDFNDELRGIAMRSGAAGGVACA